MPEDKVTRRFKTSREVTESELLQALRHSMGPIFAHLEEKLLKEDGQQLSILVEVKAGKITLKYGVSKI